MTSNEGMNKCHEGFMKERERERESESERETERDRDRERQRETERENRGWQYCDYKQTSRHSCGAT